jgi:hypothetical protein
MIFRLICLSVSVVVIKCGNTRPDLAPHKKAETLAFKERISSGMYKVRRYKLSPRGYLVPFPCFFARKQPGNDATHELVLQNSSF